MTYSGTTYPYTIGADCLDSENAHPCSIKYMRFKRHSNKIMIRDRCGGSHSFPTNITGMGRVFVNFFQWKAPCSLLSRSGSKALTLGESFGSERGFYAKILQEILSDGASMVMENIFIQPGSAIDALVPERRQVMQTIDFSILPFFAA